MPLGISRQLAGDAAFGADGFRYCGSILSHPAELFEHGVSIAATAHALAAAVTRDYALVGLNGIDFVARRGVAYPVEVNPRWCASVELVERAHGFSMFGLHADACSRGTLPDDRIPLCLRRAVGKAIVFARDGPRRRRDGELAVVSRRRGRARSRGTPHSPRRPDLHGVRRGRRPPRPATAALVRRAEAVYDEVRGWTAPPSLLDEFPDHARDSASSRPRACCGITGPEDAASRRFPRRCGRRRAPRATRCRRRSSAAAPRRSSAGRSPPRASPGRSTSTWTARWPGGCCASARSRAAPPCRSGTTTCAWPRPSSRSRCAAI